MTKYSESDRKRALDLHRKQWGYDRVAQIIGCFPSTVKKWVEAAGQQKHPGPKYPKAKRDHILNWYKKNDVTIQEVSSKFKIHPKTLSRWLREDGIAVKNVSKIIDRKSVILDIKSGMKKKDIAKKYKCSESMIYRIQNGG